MMMMMIQNHSFVVHILVGRRKTVGLWVQQEKVRIVVGKEGSVFVGRRLQEAFVSASPEEESDEEVRTGLGIDLLGLLG